MSVFPMSRLEFFDMIGEFLKYYAPCVNTKRIQRKERKKKIVTWNLETKEIYYTPEPVELVNMWNLRNLRNHHFFVNKKTNEIKLKLKIPEHCSRFRFRV